jgi:hypothetical protein
MIRKMLWVGFIGVIIFAGAFAHIMAAGQPGVTETVFNRRFIPTLKPQMTYEQIMKMAGGVPGTKIGEDKKAAPPVIQYRWKGGRDSVLTARFRNNRMMDATVQKQWRSGGSLKIIGRNSSTEKFQLLRHNPNIARSRAVEFAKINCLPCAKQ